MKLWVSLWPGTHVIIYQLVEAGDDHSRHGQHPRHDGKAGNNVVPHPAGTELKIVPRRYEAGQKTETAAVFEYVGKTSTCYLCVYC